MSRCFSCVVFPLYKAQMLFWGASKNHRAEECWGNLFVLGSGFFFLDILIPCNNPSVKDPNVFKFFLVDECLTAANQLTY